MDTINRIRRDVAKVDYATKGEVAEAAKAVSDYAKGELATRVKSLHDAVEGRVKSLHDHFETSTTETMASVKSLVNEAVLEAVGIQFKDIDTTFVLRMAKALDGNFDRLVGEGLSNRLKAVSDQYDAGIAKLQKTLDAREKKIQDAHAAQLEAIRKSHEDGLTKIHDMLKALVIPAPNVTVNVPESAVQVHVPAAQVNVTVPEQAAPVVNVAAAEVTVPPPRLTKKTLEYDAHGRPVVITEQEI